MESQVSGPIPLTVSSSSRSPCHSPANIRSSEPSYRLNSQAMNSLSLALFTLKKPAGLITSASRCYRQVPERPGGEEPFPLQVGNGLLHVPPVGVLGKDRADADLEGGLSRPPVQVTVTVKKKAVDFDQLIVHEIGKRFSFHYFIIHPSLLHPCPQYLIVHPPHRAGHILVILHHDLAGIAQLRVVSQAAGQLVEIFPGAAQVVHGVIMNDAKPVFQAAKADIAVQEGIALLLRESGRTP